MEIIHNSIKCSFCKQVLDTPVLLPCGESICKKHTSDDESEFYCASCCENHTKPAGGFYLNRAFKKIIETQIFEFNFGKEYNSTLESCKKLASVVNVIDTLKSNPFLHIQTVVAELKSKVNTKRQELKFDIDEQADAIVSELDDYEAACKSNISSIVDLKETDKFWESYKHFKVELDKWFKELDILSSNEKKWLSIKEKSEELLSFLVSKADFIKNELLINKLKQFELKQADFDETEINFKMFVNFFGSYIYLLVI